MFCLGLNWLMPSSSGVRVCLNVFGWCPESAMGVYPEARGVYAHSVFGMCQLEPNWSSLVRGSVSVNIVHDKPDHLDVHALCCPLEGSLYTELYVY